MVADCSKMAQLGHGVSVRSCALAAQRSPGLRSQDDMSSPDQGEANGGQYFDSPYQAEKEHESTRVGVMQAGVTADGWLGVSHRPASNLGRSL
jgi:hypothetical protein